MLAQAQIAADRVAAAVTKRPGFAWLTKYDRRRLNAYKAKAQRYHDAGLVAARNRACARHDSLVLALRQIQS